MPSLRPVLVVVLFSFACGGSPPPESEPVPAEPVAVAEPAAPVAPPPQRPVPTGPASPEECAAQNPERTECRWSVQMATFFAPCCGNMGTGNVCVCNACETDADCGRGAVCRELQSRQHVSPTTTARVCLARRDPCFHDPPRCGPREYCAHDGEGHPACMEFGWAPP